MTHRFRLHTSALVVLGIAACWTPQSLAAPDGSSSPNESPDVIPVTAVVPPSDSPDAIPVAAVAPPSEVPAAATMASVGTGQLTVEKKGPVRTMLWVDGQSKGKIKGKKPFSAQVAAGQHEVWMAMDGNATITMCHGLVEVPANGTATVLARTFWLECDGLTPAYRSEQTAFKGASIWLSIENAIDAWVSIDGGRRLSLPEHSFELNLAPGNHTIVLYRDIDSSTVFDQGQVTLRAGEQVRLTCTTAGCIGFDSPPIVLEVYHIHEGPLFQLNVNSQQTVNDQPSSSSTDVEFNFNSRHSSSSSSDSSSSSTDVQLNIKAR